MSNLRKNQATISHVKKTFLPFYVLYILLSSVCASENVDLSVLEPVERATAQLTTEASDKVEALNKKFIEEISKYQNVRSNTFNFKIYGKITGRTAEHIYVFGKALGGDGLNLNQLGTLVEDGYIVIENYNVASIHGSMYVGQHQFLGVNEGTNGFGAKVFINKYGSSPDLMVAKEKSELALIELVRASNDSKFRIEINNKIIKYLNEGKKEDLELLLTKTPSIQSTEDIQSKIKKAIKFIESSNNLDDIINSANKLANNNQFDDAIKMVEGFTCETLNFADEAHDKINALRERTIKDLRARRQTFKENDDLASSELLKFAEILKKLKSDLSTLEKNESDVSYAIYNDKSALKESIKTLYSIKKNNRSQLIEISNQLIDLLNKLKLNSDKAKKYPNANNIYESISKSLSELESNVESKQLEENYEKYYLDLIDRLPDMPYTPNKIVDCRIILQLERNEYPNRWLNSPSQYFDRWLNLRLIDLINNINIENVSDEGFISYLKYVYEKDFNGLINGEYLSLFNLMENRLGNLQMENAQHEDTPVINAWNVLRGVKMSFPAKLHHVSLINTFNKNKDVYDVSLISSVIKDDQKKNPQFWNSTQELMLTYATLQLSQAQFFYLVHEKDKLIIDCFTKYEKWSSVNFDPMYGKRKDDWLMSLKLIDIRVINGLSSLSQGAALLEDAVPKFPTGKTDYFKNSFNSFWISCGKAVQQINELKRP